MYVALVDGHHQLFRVATDGKSEPEQLTSVDEELYAPQVSPDGEHVAVTIYTHTKTVSRKLLK